MQQFKVGQVWVDDGNQILKYRIIKIDGNDLHIEVVYTTTEIWNVGEKDIFNPVYCEGDHLDKEHIVKRLLEQIDEQIKEENSHTKRPQQGNEGAGKQKPKKGCKTCDSKGCRCHAKSKRSV